MAPLMEAGSRYRIWLIDHRLDKPYECEVTAVTSRDAKSVSVNYRVVEKGVMVGVEYDQTLHNSKWLTDVPLAVGRVDRMRLLHGRWMTSAGAPPTSGGKGGPKAKHPAAGGGSGSGSRLAPGPEPEPEPEPWEDLEEEVSMPVVECKGGKRRAPAPPAAKPAKAAAPRITAQQLAQMKAEMEALKRTQDALKRTQEAQQMELTSVKDAQSDLPILVGHLLDMKQIASATLKPSAAKIMPKDCYYMRYVSAGKPCKSEGKSAIARQGLFVPKEVVRRIWEDPSQFRLPPDQDGMDETELFNKFKMLQLFQGNGEPRHPSQLTAYARCKKCIEEYDLCGDDQKLVVRAHGGWGNCVFCRISKSTCRTQWDNWMCPRCIPLSRVIIKAVTRPTILTLFNAVAEVTGHDVTVSDWDRYVINDNHGTMRVDYVITFRLKGLRGDTHTTHTLFLELDKGKHVGFARDSTASRKERNRTIRVMNHMQPLEGYKAMIRFIQGRNKTKGKEPQEASKDPSDVLGTPTRYLQLREWVVVWLRSTQATKAEGLGMKPVYKRGFPVAWLMYMYYPPDDPSIVGGAPNVSWAPRMSHDGPILDWASLDPCFHNQVQRVLLRERQGLMAAWQVRAPAVLREWQLTAIEPPGLE